jgi:hypothetical protein
MKVRYSSAVADLIAIADYICERNPLRRRQSRSGFGRQLANEMFPLIGRLTDDPSIRVIPIVRILPRILRSRGQRDRDPPHSSRTPKVIDPGGVRSQ